MSDMKLSEEIKSMDGNTRHIGYNMLDRWVEKVRALEDRVEELEKIAYPQYSDEFLAITDEIDRNLTSGG